MRSMPWACEEGCGAGEEAGAGVGLLVVVDLGVGQAGVVVDGGVDVVVADPGLLLRVGLAGLSAVGPPAAAVRDPSDLLHVEVEEFTGPGAFVAGMAAAFGADGLSGQRVAGRQARHLVAAQDAGHRPCGDTGFRGEEVRPAPVSTPCIEHCGLDVFGCSPRAGAWAAGAVVQAVPALGPEAGHPSVRALPRDSQFLGHVRHRAPVVHDTAHQKTSAVKGQPGISVGHQDLRLW